MAFDQAINFRGTSGYVTDTGTEAPILGTNQAGSIYLSTTAQGNNVGWEENLGGSAADRSTGVDHRLAGINYAPPGQDAYFRIDLPSAGTYRIHLAAGDASFANGPFKVEIVDNTTVLATPVNNAATSSANHYFDATGVERTSDTDWANNNAYVDLTFSSTVFRLHAVGMGGYCVLAYLRVQDAPSGTTYNQGCTGSTAPVASRSTQTGKIARASDSAAATRISQSGIIRRGATSAAASRASQTGHQASASNSAVASRAAQIAQSKTITATTSPVGSESSIRGRVSQASNAASAALTRGLAKTLQGTVSPLALRTALVSTARALSNSAAASLKRQAQKIAAATTAPVTSASRRAGKIAAAINNAVAALGTSFSGTPRFDQGINLRGSSGLVVDATNEFPILGTNQGSSIYPVTTTQTNSAGWEENIGASAADRNAAIDRRLAGINYAEPGRTSDFRIDLPHAGTFRITAAIGDTSFQNGPMTVAFLDGSTVLFTPVNNQTMGAANHFFDASGVERTSDADWVANQASKSLTFASTIFRMRVTGGTGYGVVAHVRVQDVATGTTFTQSCLAATSAAASLTKGHLLSKAAAASNAAVASITTLKTKLGLATNAALASMKRVPGKLLRANSTAANPWGIAFSSAFGPIVASLLKSKTSGGGGLTQSAQASTAPSARLVRQGQKPAAASTSPVASRVGLPGKLARASTAALARRAFLIGRAIAVAVAAIATRVSQPAKASPTQTAPVVSSSATRAVSQSGSASVSLSATLVKALARLLPAINVAVPTVNHAATHQTPVAATALSAPVASAAHLLGKSAPAATTPQASGLRQIAKRLTTSTSPVARLLRALIGGITRPIVRVSTAAVTIFARSRPDAPQADARGSEDQAGPRGD